MPTRREAVIERLYDVDKKAEIVNGVIVMMSPAGGLHGYASTEIVASLRDYARRTRRGVALGDNIGFIVDLPNRWSFCPDCAFHVGPLTENFIDGAPIFAVEVRSKSEYGPAAERKMAAKRADYLAAGTLVMWDVDVLRNGCVRVFRASAPESPTVYRRGESAEAEPALPGWTFAVDQLFPPDAVQE